MSFWYDWSFAEFAETPIAAIIAVLNRLSAVQAEWKLATGEATSMPWMKDSDRRKVIKRLKRQIDPHRVARRVVSPKALRAIGVNVEIVPPKQEEDSDGAES